jgi:Sulfotransferase family
MTLPAAPARFGAPSHGDRPFARHVLERTVVLPEHKVLFLPVPKAGCTTVLWLLAELAGLAMEDFAESGGPEVSAATTVHDLSRWRPEHRLAQYGGDERERLLHEDGWLRFTLVRDPARRLWSAWQSKLLLREPRFVEAFGDAPWFPRLPEDPGRLIEDFRRFVAAVGRGTAVDVHWAVQHELAGQLPLSHVGRTEEMAETLRLLEQHVGGVAWPDRPPRENRSPLALPAHAYDAAGAAVVREHYARDYAAYGYLPLLPGGAGRWESEVAPLLPVLRASIAERERLGQLHRVSQRRLRRVQSAEQLLETAGNRNAGRSRTPAITNLEEETDFNVRWAWADGRLEPGFTGVMRVRNEARSLPWSLPSLLRATRRVVLVDNGSTDGTVDVAREIAAELGAADRLELRSYPFRIARCGPEHLATPATSVHSLVHFYNWSFSQVRTSHALKWDGDMVLTDAAVAALRDLSWQVESSEAIVRIPRHPLYLGDDRHAFLDVGLRNCEAWAWPNRPGYSFAKAIDWEMPMWGGDAIPFELPEWSCVELKHLDGDEFAHWSHTDFASSARTRRKEREWTVFRALAAGAPLPDGILPVVAPPDRHVIDYVRETWLPARARVD